MIGNIDGGTADIINLSEARRDRARHDIIVRAFQPYSVKPFLDLCRSFQYAGIIMAGQYLQIWNKLASSSKYPTFMLEKLGEISGFSPMAALAKKDGSHVLARYNTFTPEEANGILRPVRMEYRMDVAKEGQKITFFHGTGDGTGQRLDIRRDDPEGYRLYEYALLQKGRVTTRMTADADGIASMLEGLVPAINRAERQARDRAHWENTRPGRSSGPDNNLHLVI